MEEHGLTKKEQLYVEEYQQIAKNLRAGWDYIFNFFKHFILIQIILISVIGMGSTIRYKVPSMTSNSPDQISSECTLGKFDTDACKKYRSALKQNFEKRKKWELYFLIALSVLAFSFSLGGALHSHSLFSISKEFVERAKRIEEILWKDISGDDDKPKMNDDIQVIMSTLHHFTYMVKAHLESPMSIKWILTIFYSIAAFGWLIVCITFWDGNLPANPYL